MKAEDDTGFRDFARARTLSMRRTAYLLCGDWHLAEDLVQTALFKLYRAWPRVKDSAGFDNYMRRVLLRCWLDERRRPWRRRENRDGIVPETEHVDRIPGISDILVDALAKLPSKQRAAVVMRYCDDLSIAEVAAAMRCSEGTVKSQTSRGLTTLRQIVDRLDLTDRSNQT
ncbi:SigE family RNA polymerase sigma factor [Actinocrispum wychmicini]|uniref:RNA polymerase sigma-70 factor (Sigma-E family) n=1 Tax=Actinocrispum wychmicini TaxID=1213861 RepID=A0A4V2S739_9PSEU|nr:SigE family RNA polymerase sigma factor [Actinocrispum wychmicini]TCO58510.1 RNA polymerase sigma-70 factor (sigma-E family) [Actinocrispum wychmicini]